MTASHTGSAPRAYTCACERRGLPYDDGVVKAAQFLADNPRWETGLRRQLRDQFVIDDVQVMDAVLLSNDMRLLRRAFG
jgi:hypothetical protein